MKGWLLPLLLSVLITIAACGDTIVLPPINPSLTPLGLVFVQGAQIDNSLYVPVAKAIQQSLADRFSLWVTMPDYPIDLPLPLGPLFSKPIFDSMQKAYDAGLPKDTPFACIGHSLGAASLQSFVFDNPQACFAQILTGGSLLRKYRNSTISGKHYPVPTMTLTGDLDGLMRISRIAESYWHQILHPTSSDASNPTNFPVVVIPGMNHMQVGSGDPPLLVRKRDLKAEISLDEAHTAIAAVVGPFIALHSTSSPTPGDVKVVVDQVKATGSILAPLIAGFEYEGYYNLMPPCDSDRPAPMCPYYPAYPVQKKPRVPSDDTFCTCSSPWTTYVGQITMAALDSNLYPMIVQDAFHDVNDINPFHHPHTWNNCTAEQTPCTINTTTVSQNIYEKFDDWDTGFVPVSALEIRVKLRSRQVMQRLTFNTSAAYNDFDNLKGSNYCAEINQKAIDWAEKIAGADAMRRYNQFGQPMIVGDDILPPIPAGPLWINNKMHYDDYTDASGKLFYKVSAPAMTTSVDGPDTWIDPPMLSGYHYCKLLSPARAMEWIYVDGLRNGMPITGTTRL